MAAELREAYLDFHGPCLHLLLLLDLFSCSRILGKVASFILSSEVTSSTADPLAFVPTALTEVPEVPSWPLVCIPTRITSGLTSSPRLLWVYLSSLFGHFLANSLSVSDAPVSLGAVTQHNLALKILYPSLFYYPIPL